MAVALAVAAHGAGFTAATASAGGLLYATTVMTAALTALLTRTPASRRTAIEILKILLRRRS
ncbi:hypothetical protein [Micromonospora okii]|uniref:hypothetical protein n=1 Tax=Micromonospora okii TaxID=1182970 RepID=UPI001E50C8FA|nr:hypothetical protein [Micromonospora okii]